MRRSNRVPWTSILIGFLLLLFLGVSAVSYEEAAVSFQRVLGEVDAGTGIRDEERAFLDRETGLRGWVATHDKRFLQPYADAQEELTGLVVEVDTRLRDLGLTQARDLQRQIAALQDEWDKEVATKLLARPHGPEAFFLLLRGKLLMDQTRSLIRTERQIVNADRLKTTSKAQYRFFALVIGAALIAILLAIVVVRMEYARAQAAARFTAILEERALFDALTGLPNRACFTEKLSQALSQAKRYGHIVAVLFIDLDGFKAVNDRFGHEAGDEVLCAAAQRLNGSIRESDTAARLGGDEFTVVLPIVTRHEEAERVAQKLVAHLKPPIPLRSGQLAQVSASIGVAFFPNDGEDSESLLKAADAAMYEAKRAGKNRYTVFTAAVS
jgi:diguanylate cyclase (GGDEF)-like protein